MDFVTHFSPENGAYKTPIPVLYANVVLTLAHKREEFVRRGEGAAEAENMENYTTVSSINGKMRELCQSTKCDN